MNILSFHKRLLDNYKSYINSFINIKDPSILEFVNHGIDNNKLWLEPLIQFNPTFEKGSSLKKLVTEGKLNKELDSIFEGYNLYRHQEEAILLGAEGKEFVVTSGTGSGKSLTYLATVFNHILTEGEKANNKIQAVIVYPMNALINSQYKEIEKFQKNYEAKIGKPFRIRFGQYTGQEDDGKRRDLRDNPPHILLTNYVMLEYIMTRGGEDVKVRNSILDNIKYLVFDELHTYRGRQGSDVSILIRRIKAQAKNHVTSIGTSATMVSLDNASILQQKEAVAKIASTIFGTDIKSNQVINEYLVRSLEGGKVPTTDELIEAINKKINTNDTVYTIEHYEYLKDDMLNLFQQLKKRILNIDSSVRVEFKKLYIAFKSQTNFVDIVPQKKRLRLSLNIEFSKIKDPNGFCKDVSGLGRWGNGDVEVGIDNINDLDNIMSLITQAFEQQVELS